MRRLLIAGNWKMNTTANEGEALAEALRDVDTNSVDVLVAPPFTHIDRVARALKGTKVFIGAQNVSEDTYGAHTGEIAAEMLADLSVDYVIVGHSECRGRGEEDATVAKKPPAHWMRGFFPLSASAKAKKFTDPVSESTFEETSKSFPCGNERFR